MVTTWMARRTRARATLTVLGAAALTVGVGVVGPGQQPADAASTPRVGGVEKRSAESSFNSQPTKDATAKCPPGKQVLGGGAAIASFSAIDGQVALTRLVPYRAGSQHAYAVSAAETYAGTTKDWSLQVWAICANPVPGHTIVNAVTDWSSVSVKTTAAVCPQGTRVLGSGAMINGSISTGPNGQPIPHDQGIGLQVTRSSGPGDITRAQAQEAVGGYAYPWQLVSYAVCAHQPPGYQIVSADSPHAASEQTKLAHAECPEYWDYRIPSLPRKFRKQTVGMGAAMSSVAPANASLTGIHPYFFDTVRVRAEENTSTQANWSTIAAQVICVY